MSARILVVDDIAANVRLLEAKLAAEYFEVVTASSGPEALESARHIDTVVLDKTGTVTVVKPARVARGTPVDITLEAPLSPR